MATRRNTAVRNRLRAAVKRGHPACHICGQPIDYDAHHLDPRSFVVDHVEPLIKGGADALTNAKAAHRSCNAAKAARDHAPIIRRSTSLN